MSQLTETRWSVWIKMLRTKTILRPRGIKKILPKNILNGLIEIKCILTSSSNWLINNLVISNVKKNQPWHC